jgi:serine/threonine-protein kinase
VPIGQTLAGRYELRALLGRGGMGEVYEAADHRLDRTVAVKVLREELARDRRFVARFHREARTAARLQHPSIVAVHDFGEDDGRVYLVLEHVPGRTLFDVLRVEGPLAPARAAGIGAHVAEALAHAHARGVVHRDVAPGNVMVRTDGTVKVLDFGIARAVQGSGHGGSVTAQGTLAYAAPEVLAGERSDQRVDVYGLGAVLYELLTGRPPFTGDDVAARLDVVRPPAPSAVDPSVSAGIDETVLRCLDRDPAARPADAGVLAEELRRLAAYLPAERPSNAITLVDVPRTDATRRLHTPTMTAALPDGPVAPLRTRRHRGRFVGVGVAITVVLAAVALVVPSVLRIDDPVRASLQVPPVLPAPGDLGAATSCDGFLSTGADVAWTGVVGASGYELWRRGASGEAWRPVATLAGGVTSHRDADLGVDSAYVYRVRALDGPLAGRWSEPATARTPLFCLT